MKEEKTATKEKLHFGEGEGDVDEVQETPKEGRNN